MKKCKSMIVFLEVDALWPELNRLVILIATYSVSTEIYM